VEQANPDNDGSNLGSSAAVGERLGKLFHLETAPSFAVTGLRTGYFAVTDIRSDKPVFGVTDVVAAEDAYLLCILERDMIDHQVWENGRSFPRHTVRQGDFLLRDLKREQAATIDQPHHSTHFYFSRAALNEVAGDAGVPRIGELDYTPGIPIIDPVASNLAACFRPALVSPEQVNRLFLEHILFAMGGHVACTYGGMQNSVRSRSSGLAQWQERLAKEMMRADLSGPSLAEIARHCGLSVGQFSRGFKQSTGAPPYRWLLQQRVEQAKRRLANSKESISSIALACGFSDQSHLTRVFARHVGVTPAAWRRDR
jgi:AraC-like DNA-binding protein